MQKSINQYHQYLNENIDPVKGEYVQSGPWCAIGLEGEAKKSVQISQDNSSKSTRRHNLYFSFHHNKLDFASKKIKVSGIVEYFDDLKNVMLEIFKEASKFNSNNSNCKINEFKTLMYTKATSIIGPHTKLYRDQVRIHMLGYECIFFEVAILETLQCRFTT